MGSLLRVSEAASIGLHAACLLGQMPDEVVNAKKIAQTLAVSEAHLLKVLNRLQKAGLVRSILGPGGGFELAKGTGDITLYDVLQGIDGPVGDAACLFNPPRCDGRGCVIGSISARVNELVAQSMGSLTLADVVSDSSRFAMMPILRRAPAKRAGKPSGKTSKKRS